MQKKKIKITIETITKKKQKSDKGYDVFKTKNNMCKRGAEHCG